MIKISVMSVMLLFGLLSSAFAGDSLLPKPGKVCESQKHDNADNCQSGDTIKLKVDNGDMKAVAEYCDLRYETFHNESLQDGNFYWVVCVKK